MFYLDQSDRGPGTDFEANGKRNRNQPGLMGAGVDPYGPKLDVLGAADPWGDRWFYTNPIWVLPR